jgi:DNA polymerase
MSKVQKLKPMEQKPRKPSSECQACDLFYRCITTCCPPSGSKKAKVMLAGEAPGKDEDEKGKPFVGDAGKKLRYILSKIGITAKSFFITNSCRCRPPKNAEPTKKQIDACAPHLLYEVLTVKPKVIVTLGATAFKTVTGLNEPVKNVRGFPEEYEFDYVSPEGKIYRHKCWVIPTYHPSAALRGGGWVYDSIIQHDIELARSYAEDNIVLSKPDTKSFIAKTIKEVEAICLRLKSYNIAAFDVETTGLRYLDDEILCIGFCVKKGEVLIIPILQQDKKKYWSDSDLEIVKDLLRDVFTSIRFIGQNIKFDLNYIRTFLGVIIKVAFDTMTAQHVMDENKPSNLTFQCQWYLRWTRYDKVMQQYIRSDVAYYHEAPNAILWKYLSYDVDGTMRLYLHHREEIKRQGLVTVFKTEISLIQPLAEAEFIGMRVNHDLMTEISAEQQNKAGESLVKLRTIAKPFFEDDHIFNPASGPQLRKLFDALNIIVEKKTKKSGLMSTDQDVLKLLMQEGGKIGEFAEILSNYRSANKLLGTYLDGFSIQGKFDGVKPKEEVGGFKKDVWLDDRIHPTYNPSRTVTGRLSANNPPIQTIPKKYRLRQMFIPDNEESVFISCDYGKIELCVMAWLANDDVMAKELINGMDLHSRMALQVKMNRAITDEEFEQLLPECEKEPDWSYKRSVAKCFHPDTEVLTKSGWKKILDLEVDEEVASAIPGMRGECVIVWSIPTEVFSMKNLYDHLLHFKDGGIDISVTPDHRMVVWNGKGLDPWRVVSAEEFPKQKYRYWVNAGSLYTSSLWPVANSIEQVMFRLAVVTQACGTFNGDGSISFTLVGTKADRMFWLLSNHVSSCWWSYRSEAKVHDFVLKGDCAKTVRSLLDGKSFKWNWISLRESYRVAIIDEVCRWNCRRMAKYDVVVNTDEQSINILQALATVTNLKTNLYVEDNVFNLRVNRHARHRSGSNLICNRIPYNDVVACLSVPSMFVVARSGQEGSDRIPIIIGQSVNFGIPYGISAKGIVDDKPESFPEGMLTDERIKLVQAMIDAYFEKYQGVRQYIDVQIATAQKKGYIQTPFTGRKRRLADGAEWFFSEFSKRCKFRNSDLEALNREALNFKVQSTASDELSKATHRVYLGIREVNIPFFRIVMTLHDQLLFNVHKDYVDEASDLICFWMNSVLKSDKFHKYEMPLKVEIGVLNE